MAKSKSMAIVTDAIHSIIATGISTASVAEICTTSGLDVGHVNGCISYYVRAGLAEHIDGGLIKVLEPLKTWKPGRPTPVNTSKLPTTGKSRKNKIERGFLSGFACY